MGKRKTQQPNYEFMDLDTFKKAVLNKKEQNERESILKYLNCSQLDVKQIRFGNPNLNLPETRRGEPDFLLRTSEGVIAVEITDAVKKEDILKLKTGIPREGLNQSNIDELISLLKMRVESKYEKPYNTQKADRFVLLIINRMNFFAGTNSYKPFRLFLNGTPQGDITKFQEEMRMSGYKNNAEFDRSHILTPKDNGADLLVAFRVEQS